MKKFIEGISAFVAIISKTIVGVAIFIAAFVADNISAAVVFVLALPLLIGTFSAGISYVNSTGRKVKRISHDRKNAISAVKTKGLNKQKYVTDNILTDGMCNMATSPNERKIKRNEYRYNNETEKSLRELTQKNHINNTQCSF